MIFLEQHYRLPDSSETSVFCSINGNRKSPPNTGRINVATRDTDGTYAMVYVPVGRKFKVRMGTIASPKAKAWWFNPRNGKAKSIGEFPNAGQREFSPPDMGELLDWVLVLDDDSKNYPAPGSI